MKIEKSALWYKMRYHFENRLKSSPKAIFLWYRKVYSRYHCENRIRLLPKAIFLIISIVAIGLLLALSFGLKNIIFKPQRLGVEEIDKPKIAVVIDDWGYNLHCINQLRAIKVPVTISILPNLPYSTQIAETAHDLGQEVILHLPLEPEMAGREIGLEQHTITTLMSEDEVVKQLRLNLACVAYANGVSNHMGSRATTDTKLMSAIFNELKRERLFFLDNLVTAKSVCRPLAKNLQLKLAWRDFFLDNSDDYEYIRGQFNKLIEFAQSNGRAIGIGHAKPMTLQVLQEMVPLMQAEGIKLVPVSDLAE